MADPFSTIIGQLANIVSFKSALRLLVIAGSIIACWAWVQPRLINLQIPAELLSTIIVVIGFSLGALVTSIAFSIFDSINNLIITKIEKNKKAIIDLQKEEAVLEKNNKENELLIKSFDIYSSDAKSILLKLISKDDKINIHYMSQTYRDAFKGLIDGKIVIILKVIDTNTTFCTINPIFRDTINNLFDEKHKREVNDLFERNPSGLDKLILLFKDNTLGKEHVFGLDADIDKNDYYFKPVIKNESYYPGEVSEGHNVQYYIDDHHYPFMVEQLGNPLRGFVLCRALKD